MSQPKLLELFRAKASEIGEKSFSHINEEDCISSLGLDSLNLLELTGSFEREFKIHIPEEKLNGVQTVGQFLTIVAGLLPSTATTAP